MADGEKPRTTSLYVLHWGGVSMTPGQATEKYNPSVNSHVFSSQEAELMFYLADAPLTISSTPQEKNGKQHLSVIAARKFGQPVVTEIIIESS